MIVSEPGLVKLIDFGLAKTKQSTVHSQAGVIKGKFGYVAPEYLDGQLDARCDLWALGVVAHELLTGRRLFDGPSTSTRSIACATMPIPPPSRANPRGPAELDQIVMTALERDPDRRWQSAAAMRTALAEDRRHALSPAAARCSGSSGRSRRRRRSRARTARSRRCTTSSRVRRVELVGDLPAISEAMLQRRRESVAMMPIGAALLDRRSGTRWWLWLLLLVVLAGGGAIAAWQLGLFR